MFLLYLANIHPQIFDARRVPFLFKGDFEIVPNSLLYSNRRNFAVEHCSIYLHKQM